MAESCEWTVSGMDCGSCAGKVRDAVGRMPGVSDVSVSIMSERLKLTLDPALTPPEAVERAVRALGYGVSPRGAAGRRKTFAMPDDAPAPVGAGAGQGDGQGQGIGQGPERAGQGPERVRHEGHGHAHGHLHDHAHDDASSGRPWYRKPGGRLVIATGLLLAAAWAAALLAGGPAGQWGFVAATLLGVAPVARRALAALRMGQPFTIESLMTIAATGALFIGAAEEAALVVFLFAVGELLEGVAAGRARSGIRALSALVPRRVLLLAGDAPPREVAADSLRVGDLVLARPGDRIPADGEITDGTGGVDESPVTGESVPVTRGPGDPVFAGAINGEAALRIRVTRAAGDNTIARIIRLVEEAEEARAPTERFIDRFSRWYMPLIVVLSALVAALPPLLAGGEWQVWIYRGLALLLIGCPCALVISVPASIASALSAGARRGLLLKGGAVIEAAAALRQVAFDKTGTLTAGRPAVTDIVPLALPEAGLLRLAAAVEAHSAHPLAQAIRDRAAGLALPAATDAAAIPGKGAAATVEGRRLTVASPAFAAEAGALDPEAGARAAALENEGKTVAVLFSDRALGLIALRDEPRPDAARAVAELRAMGLTPVILTGDNPRTAAAIAGALGTGFRAALLPEGKLDAIRDMGAAGVMMVGDGINDAPALKLASVGVAMGSGTDVALETADAAILRSRVTDVPALIRLSRAAMANIRQNVAIALGLKAVFLVTTVLGVTGLWIAILADTGATVLVTLNALRLLRHDPAADRGGH